jgi:hypothetical protein
MAYIVCRRKKSRPKTSVSVCERCSHNRSCSDYRSYVQPPLFPGLTRKDAEKRPRRGVAKTGKSGIFQKQEHMPFMLA